jgi:hypothetical protein
MIDNEKLAGWTLPRSSRAMATSRSPDLIDHLGWAPGRPLLTAPDRPASRFGLLIDPAWTTIASQAEAKAAALQREHGERWPTTFESATAQIDGALICRWIH